MVLLSASLPTREGWDKPGKGLPAGTRDMARVPHILGFCLHQRNSFLRPHGSPLLRCLNVPGYSQEVLRSGTLGFILSVKRGWETAA